MKEKIEFIAGFIIGLILIHLLFKKKEGWYDRIFNRWTKWEIHKEDIPYIATTYSISGLPMHEDRVFCDIYVKTNKYNGLKKYKRVEKFQ